MAGQIPDRSPEHQQIYDDILPRLLGGDSLKVLAAETGIKYGTLSAWRSRATKRMPQPIREPYDRQLEILDKLSETLGSAASAEIAVGQEITKRNSASEVKNYLLDNASDTLSLLASLRSGVQRGLSEAQAGILAGLSAASESLQSGLITKHATCDGEITQCEVRMSPSDLSNLSTTLGRFTEQLAKLHNLPLGALNIASIKLDNTPNQHQHLHLHQSYGGDNNPVIGQAPEVSSELTSTPAGEDKMQAWQRRLMEDE